MKICIRTISFIISAFTVCSLFSCGKLNDPLSEQEIEDILCDRYDKEFTLVSDNTNEKNVGTMIFKDDEGIETNVEISTSNAHFSTAYEYSAKEDYVSAYYKAHPELFEPFKAQGHDFRAENGEYIMYYNGFDEIAGTVAFACKTANEMDQIAETVAKKKLYCYSETIKFVPSDISSDELYYPSISIPSYKPLPCMESSKYSEDDVQAKIREVQTNYVEILRKTNDKDRLAGLPEEQIMLDPLDYVYDITLDDKVIFDEMHYLSSYPYREGKSDGYSYSSCIHHAETGEVTEEELLNSFDALGWKIDISGKDLSFTNGTDVLNFHIHHTNETIYEGEGGGYRYDAEVTFNGEQYELDGYWGVSSNESNYNRVSDPDHKKEQYTNDQYDFGFTFTEKDFRDIFGVEFEFDQINSTGKIVKCGS